MLLSKRRIEWVDVAKGIAIIAAFSGISAACIGSIWIARTTYVKKTLIFLGRNTIPIMALHIPWGYIAIETLYYKMFGLAYGKNIFSDNIEPYAFAASVQLILASACELINRFAPWMVGETRGRT